jgi:hypothetical protein
MNPGGSGGVGLHFVHGNDSMFVNEIILYQELGGNEGYYDTGTDRVIDTARLGSGSTISSICRVTISTCLNITDDVSISFTRPSPEPIVRRTQGSGVIEVSNSIKINLQEVLAGEEEIIFVQIAPTGQVSVGK